MVNVKKVSDVGLRYLADGCHNLEEINGKSSDKLISEFTKTSFFILDFCSV